MEECKYTDFGIRVKTILLKKGKTQEWLISQVRERTGMFFDDSYLYKILTGQRIAAKQVDVIREILGMDNPEKNQEGAIS